MPLTAGFRPGPSPGRGERAPRALCRDGAGHPPEDDRGALRGAVIERDELIGDDCEEVFKEAEAVDPTLTRQFERKLLQFRAFMPPPAGERPASGSRPPQRPRSPRRRTGRRGSGLAGAADWMDADQGAAAVAGGPDLPRVTPSARRG